MKKLLILGTIIAILISGTQMVHASSVKDVFHFGFKKSKDGQSASINEEGFKHILEKHGAIFMGDTKQKELYLTFDNGYENGYTPAILDVLKEKKVPAAFFCNRSLSERQARPCSEDESRRTHCWESFLEPSRPHGNFERED